MFKRNSVVAILLIIVLLLSGCGVNSKEAPKVDVAPAEAPAVGRMEYNEASDGFGYSEEYDYEVQAEAGKANSTSPSTSALEEDIRMVIKNGEIAIEVESVDNTYNQIASIISSLEGEEFNKSYSLSGQYKRMELVIKIPPQNLDEFQSKLAELVGPGKIIRSSIQSQDITSQYYDINARLNSFKASRDQLQKLLDKAETVEDTLKIHSELSRMQAEIDALQGQINMWDKLVDMATITLYIDEIGDPMKQAKPVTWKFSSPQDVWRTMKNGFISVVNTLYSLITWGVVIIVSLLPAIIPVLIIIWFIIRRQRKKRKDGSRDNDPPLA